MPGRIAFVAAPLPLDGRFAIYNQGDLDFYWYGFDSGKRGAVELHDRLGQDDHNTAAMFRLDNGETLAAWLRHGTEPVIYLRRTAPHRPAVWGEIEIYRTGADATCNNLLTAKNNVQPCRACESSGMAR